MPDDRYPVLFPCKTEVKLIQEDDSSSPEMTFDIARIKAHITPFATLLVQRLLVKLGRLSLSGPSAPTTSATRSTQSAAHGGRWWSQPPAICKADVNIAEITGLLVTDHFWRSDAGPAPLAELHVTDLWMCSALKDKPGSSGVPAAVQVQVKCGLAFDGFNATAAQVVPNTFLLPKYFFCQSSLLSIAALHLVFTQWEPLLEQVDMAFTCAWRLSAHQSIGTGEWPADATTLNARPSCYDVKFHLGCTFAILLIVSRRKMYFCFFCLYL